jgi:hypothetical protein
MLVDSDAVYNGFGLNMRELKWFVKMGMSAEQALQTATVIPAEIRAFALAFDAEYVARSAFTSSSRRLRKKADTASEPLVSLAAKAAGSVMAPLESDVALFSICSHPSRMPIPAHWRGALPLAGQSKMAPWPA